jgi:hypothetical protein
MAQERNDLDKFGNHMDMETAARDDTRENDISTRHVGRTDDDDLDRDTENIREQIADTRNQMGDTIDEIQDRLSFSNISEQVSEHVQNAVETGKDAIYNATIGKAATFMKNAADNISNSSVVKSAKDNPLPLVLIGVGAGLLAYRSFTKPAYRESWRYGHENRQDREFDRSMTEPDRGTLAGITGKASETAGQTMDKVSGAFNRAYTGAGTVMTQAYEKADEFRGAAIDRYQTYLSQNPLALGAAALALGAAVGMAIPASTYESELLGETRDDLLDKAQNAAAGLLDKTKQAIVEADIPVITHKGSAIEH